jgi:hypothetical protein
MEGKVVNQKIEIDNRKIINVSCVDEVLSSTEKELYARLDRDILQITGEGLKIIKLEPEEKILVVSGKINGLVFTSKLNKKSFFKRLFK